MTYRKFCLKFEKNEYKDGMSQRRETEAGAWVVLKFRPNLKLVVLIKKRHVMGGKGARGALRPACQPESRNDGKHYFSKLLFPGQKLNY